MKVVIALASSSGNSQACPGMPSIWLAAFLHVLNSVKCIGGAPWQQDFIKDAAPRDDARLHLTSAPIGNSAMSRNLWFYARLPKLAARLNADIVHLAYPCPSSAVHFAVRW